jgi:hypothetical protein
LFSFRFHTQKRFYCKMFIHKLEYHEKLICDRGQVFQLEFAYRGELWPLG